MSKFKKIFTSIILVLAIVLTMIGCNKTKPNNPDESNNPEPPKKEMLYVSDILTSSANELLNKDSFSTKVSLETENQSYKLKIDVDLKIVKTKTGYDFDIFGESSKTFLEETEKDKFEEVEDVNYFKIYKVGNLLYNDDWEKDYDENNKDDYLEDTFDVSYVKEIDNIIDLARNYIDPVLDTAKDAINLFNGSKQIEKNKDGYSFTLGKNYSEDLQSVLTDLQTNKDTQILTYLIAKLVASGYQVSITDITDTLDNIFNDEIKIGEIIDEIDTLIKVFSPELSIKKIADGICDIANLTASDIYTKYITSDELKLIFDTEPTESQTVYDYFYSMLKNKALVPIIKMATGNEDFSLSNIKDFIVGMITNEELTVESTMDILLSLTESLLEKASDSLDIDIELPEDFTLDFDTLVNLKIENATAIFNTKLNSDNTLNELNLDLISKIETNDETPVILSNTSIKAKIAFEYNKVAVKLHDNIKVFPYIEASNYYLEDIKNYTENGLKIKYNLGDYDDINIDEFGYYDMSELSEEDKNIFKDYVTINKDTNEIVIAKEFFVEFYALSTDCPNANIDIEFVFSKENDESSYSSYEYVSFYLENTPTIFDIFQEL